jgi:hypothetical protein
MSGPVPRGVNDAEDDSIIPAARKENKIGPFRINSHARSDVVPEVPKCRIIAKQFERLDYRSRPEGKLPIPNSASIAGEPVVIITNPLDNL